MTMLQNIKTDEALIERLEKSGLSVTKEQLRRQRISFIYGSLPADSTITKAQIAAAIARIEGEDIDAG